MKYVSMVSTLGGDIRAFLDQQSRNLPIDRKSTGDMVVCQTLRRRPRWRG